MAKLPTARKLVTAIKKGDINAVSAMISDGVDMSSRVDNLPPLFWTVYENQPEIARLLLNAGCDVDIPQDDGTTPLCSCSAIRNDVLSEKEAIILAELLIESGANVMACGKSHHCAPLAMAKYRGKKKLAKLLSDHGARAFNITIVMRDESGKPLAGEFYYGPPKGNWVIKKVNRTGELKLEHVFPGQFLIGYDGNNQLVTINEDETSSPSEIRWRVE
jgi:ankyrin repeat protein